MAGDPVEEPFPIYRLNNRYLLYDANVVSHVRSTHHMCGTLTGTLPQIPQQNIFLGLPLELMCEEAALLVEKGTAYIVDDTLAHKKGLQEMPEEAKTRFLAEREQKCRLEAEAHQKAVEERKLAFTNWGSKKKDKDTAVNEDEEDGDGDGDEEATAVSDPSTSSSKPAEILRFHPTATASSPVYHSPVSSPLAPKPMESSYVLYKHLHSFGYFLSPGLRFGCQFTAYPGDPLRFHSHFVANGMGWDEEMEMRDVVGGGRLGTGVKKAWMVGGADDSGRVRTFCVEWGGF